jgi:acetyl-CoA carboxylase biotin carboxyl carrier protein
MELKEIQELIKFVSKSGVSEVELESKGFKLIIKTGSGQAPAQPAVVQAVPTTVPAVAPVIPVPTPTPVTPPIVAQTPATTPPPSTTPKTDDTSKYITVKSPMIGTFYRSPGPDKPPFVNVGDEIKPGQVLCIIEAMKLFNEIESEVAGRIVKVLVDDAKPVEYDQPLFLVEPL